MSHSYMKNKILSLISLLFAANTITAQMNFSFTPNAGSFNAIVSGATPFFSGNGSDPLADEGFANDVPIGFNFMYNSNTSYTKVSISTNGFLSFKELSDAHVSNNLSSGAADERPIVAPLWDDLDVQSTTNISYITTGSAPNRIFTVQWLNVKWGFGAANAAISFQVKLYETSNWIEFIYRAEAGSPLSPSASVGLTANGTGNNNFLSIASLGSNPNVSTTNEVNNIFSKPSNNQSYIFKIGTLPTIISSFKVIKEKNSHQVQWQTEQEINAYGFDVERSADGTRFSTLGFIASKTSNGNSSNALQYNYTDTKPIVGTNYYRLKQIDKDGTIYYSTIYALKNSSNNVASVQLYPNPVKNNLFVFLNDMMNTEVVVNVFSVHGKQMLQRKIAVTQNNSSLQFDVTLLPTGIYTVQVMNARTNQSITQRFVK
jgi:hypothetical protein